MNYLQHKDPMTRTTWRYLSALLPLMTLTWIVFKYYYPFADYFNDSYTYIGAAADRYSISFRPIGYSIFLRFIHTLSVTDTFLVTVQYVLVQCACLCLFFFLVRHCDLARWARLMLAAFLVADPLVYYTSNIVSSDAVFLALTLFWLTLLLQLLRRPTWGALVLQWILLGLIFYTRYVALFYPAVAALTFFVVKRDLRYKLTAIAGSIAVVTAGAFYTQRLTREQTGTPIFSAFSGWQLANNAIQIYPWLPADTTGLPPESDQLARYVSTWFDQQGAAIKKTAPGATTFYMWSPGSPLHQYFDAYRARRSSLRQRPDTAELGYFTAWNRVAPIFTAYGHFLIARHPVAFTRYYLWPSAKDFFLSPLDVLAVYNEGKDEVDTVAQNWFHYRSNKLKVRSATIQGKLLAPFPWFFLGLNVAFGVTGILLLVRRRPIRRQESDRSGRYPFFITCLQLVTGYLLANAGFNIFAASSVFRYQVLPLILLFAFTVGGISLFFVSFCSTNDKKNQVP
jgi:4-amino-4-deoxy-L-arabinose transferase-like glycosyltransferase